MDKKKEKIEKYIEEVVGEITRIVPLIKFCSIRWQKEKTNSGGGEFSIDYEPTLFDATFYIYTDIFKQVPELTRKQKTYVKKGLYHEVGHIYLWELEGTKRDTEKIATQIGMIILELLDDRKI